MNKFRRTGEHHSHGKFLLYCSLYIVLHCADFFLSGLINHMKNDEMVVFMIFSTRFLMYHGIRFFVLIINFSIFMVVYTILMVADLRNSFLPVHLRNHGNRLVICCCCL